MRITIIGGGNIGTLMAAEMAHNGHSVTVYTKRADKWSKIIKVLNRLHMPHQIEHFDRVS